MKKIPELSTKEGPGSGQHSGVDTSEAYWSKSSDQLFSALNSSAKGLQTSDVNQRLKQYGLNTIRAQQKTSALKLLLSQFKSPLVLILIFAAIVSGVVKEWVDASIVLAIVLGSTI